MISVNKQPRTKNKHTHNSLGKRLQRRQRLKTNDLQSFVVIFLLRKKDKKCNCSIEGTKHQNKLFLGAFRLSLVSFFFLVERKQTKTSYRLTILFPRPHVFFFRYIHTQQQKAPPPRKKECVCVFVFSSCGFGCCLHHHNEIVIQTCKCLCCITHTHTHTW